MIGVGPAALRLFYPVFRARVATPRFTLPIVILCLGITGYMNQIDSLTLSDTGSAIFYPVLSFGMACLLATILETECHLKPLRWSGLGDIAAISYSLYLSHKIVLHLDDHFLPKTWMTGWSQIIIYYTSSLTVANALYFAVEQPFMKLRNRLLAHMKKPPQKTETAFNSIASD